MYKEFFGLQKRPFALTSDPEFLFLSKTHDLAISHLEYGLLQNSGFIALTGEVGSGKTVILKYLIHSVGEGDTATVFLSSTNLDPVTLLEMLVKEFQLSCASTRKIDLYETLKLYFRQQSARGQGSIIFVDEAQNLPLDSMEELRMLSNVEQGGNFPVQIFLIGQPEFRERLAHPSYVQLAQRISSYYHLTSLSQDEIKQYIDHRLKVAGYKEGNSLFDDKAVSYIATLSHGIPRLINSLCDASLAYAYGGSISRVGREIVETVIHENEMLLVGAKTMSPSQGVWTHESNFSEPLDKQKTETRNSFQSRMLFKEEVEDRAAGAGEEASYVMEPLSVIGDQIVDMPATHPDKRDESHTKEESNVFKEWEDESKTETSDQNGAVLKNSMSSKKPYWAQKNLKKNGTGKKKKGKFWSFITGQGVH